MDSLEAYKGYYGDHHGNQGDGYTHSTNDLQGQLHSRTSSLNIEDIDVQYYIIDASISYCTCEATNCVPLLLPVICLDLSLHSCLGPTHQPYIDLPIQKYNQSPHYCISCGSSVSKLHAFQPPRMTESEASKGTECQRGHGSLWWHTVKSLMRGQYSSCSLQQCTSYPLERCC